MAKEDSCSTTLRNIRSIESGDDNHHPIHLDGNLLWIVDPDCSLFVVLVISISKTRQALQAENIVWIYHSMVIIQEDAIMGCPHVIVVCTKRCVCILSRRVKKLSPSTFQAVYE
jgi:hypothetical protein